ncbi:MAG: hypothetical protein QXO86_01285, partial [Nitrososphaerota archaeon]
MVARLRARLNDVPDGVVLLGDLHTTQEYVLALNAAQDLVTHLLLREGATHVFPIETTLYEFQPPP